jgi:hypothetical protein
MATTTPNFGWAVPTSTDLVKNGAVAIETLGDSIDASLVDLKGGTTGQVLAKASGTDMDFSWVAIDPLVILDAKGDLITATAADTPARLAVGTNGQYLQADSTASTGLKWATAATSGMTQIAQTIVTGAAASSVTFSSLGSYTNLKVVITARGTYADTLDSMALRFNSDSGSNYDFQRLNNNGVTVSANENFGVSFDFPGAFSANTAGANLAGSAMIEIPDYRNTTYNKNTITSNISKIGTSSTNLLSKYNVGCWRNTAAITSLTFSFLSGNIGIGSIFTVYGEL